MIIRVTLGYPGDVSFVGDWIAQGHTGVGVFRPTNGLLYVKNDLSTGFADVNIVYGMPNNIPVAGHWDISGPAPHNSVIVTTVNRRSGLSARYHAWRIGHFWFLKSDEM